MKLMTFSDNPYAFWAKLPQGEKESLSFHPLLCHMVDVAAVTQAMWRTVLSEAAREEIAAALDLSEEITERWVVFLAALHDLGKASPAFQLREEAAHLRPLYTAMGALPPNLQASDAPHGRVTAGELPELLVKNFGLDIALARSFAKAIGGHHGIFPTSSDLLPPRYRIDGSGRGPWKTARAEIVELLAALMDAPRTNTPQRVNHATLMVIAGLVSVADWIGSNDRFFPYLVRDWRNLPDVDPADYLHKAENQAADALNRLGWMGWEQSSERRAFDELFPEILSCRPLQNAAIELAEKVNRTGIVIIEAPMGEGKTEAALYLADHWGIAPGPRGIYVALPTQATSNQMFGRVRKFLARRYPENKVNLQLLHGHAALSAEFETLRKHGDQVFRLDGVFSDGECASQAMSIVAAEWFTHRKRGLLAPFGVGTIDQALMAVLQTRHVFVRLFGLSHKVVIIDEVHAYDAYMSKLLERLLEWLAVLGSPVALLSATLPQERRKALLAAYRRGLGQSETNASLIEAAYPRITWATESEAGDQSIAVSENSSRTLQLKWIDGRAPDLTETQFNLGEELKAALSGGGCAAVICNTVSRAQQIYRALQPYFESDELDLFHARYLFKDRDKREKRALIRFGKEGEEVEIEDGRREKVVRPRRAVLVATQVIEQSLDLDFDLMVTDLAPVDLVLQRSGRLHRHKQTRPEGLKETALWICLPEAIKGDAPSFDSGTEAVYDAHILLRSWLALAGKSSINIPGDIERLIEYVYGERSCPETASNDLRQRWEETQQGLQAELGKMESIAQNNIIPDPRYEDDILEVWNRRLEEDEPEIHQSLQALTRLTDQNVSVVCLTPDERKQIDFSESPDIDAARFLLRRSVNLNNRAVVWKLLRQLAPEAWQRSALLRHHRLIELDENSCWKDSEHEIRLDAQLGVLITKL
ncbi:MAG: CRISPR-associated helicase Cas3' [Acidobacteriota bacterium]